MRPRCSSSCAPAEHLVGHLVDELRVPAPDHVTGEPPLVRRVAALELLGEDELLLVDVRERELAQRRRRLDDVNGAPVRDRAAPPRLRDRRERVEVVERAPEQRARLDQERLRLLVRLWSWMSVAVPIQKSIAPSSSRIGTARPRCQR